MVPPELLAMHLYVAQWTSWRKAPVSNFGKSTVPFSKMCRIWNGTTTERIKNYYLKMCSGNCFFFITCVGIRRASTRFPHSQWQRFVVFAHECMCVLLRRKLHFLHPLRLMPTTLFLPFCWNIVCVCMNQTAHFAFVSILQFYSITNANIRSYSTIYPANANESKCSHYICNIIRIVHVCLRSFQKIFE